MFVSELSAPLVKSKDMHQKSDSRGRDMGSVTKDVLIELAPDLINEGIKLLSSSLAGFTQDYTNETIVHKNFKGELEKAIFIPRHISIIRASFPLDMRKSKCGDNFGSANDIEGLENRVLQIELDVIKSQGAFYFQAKHFYYEGKDTKNNSIDEINLSFAFVTANKNLSDPTNLKFHHLMCFKNMEKGRDYNFKIDPKNYDTTYQSAWISSESLKKGPYTMLFKIEEKRYSKPWVQAINRIYTKHENKLEKKINQEIQEVLAKRGEVGDEK
jgi:hypothetical protein